MKLEQFRSIYIPMFDINRDAQAKTNPLYDWRSESTYIRRPPYWEGGMVGEKMLKGMRPLAVLPDNITTDHLSPSNAIMMDSAAGEYLHKMGVPEVDFNSYATHRGDHLTAQRATFANPKLFNEMVLDESGKVKQGSFARIEPEGKVTRMWEAIETYMERKQPLIIIAGADYGQGSSRDWAAKGVALAGVEAIAAEGFERIHRTNLVGMGVMPLQFEEGTTRKTLNIDGTETFDVEGTAAPGAKLTLIIHRKMAALSECRWFVGWILRKSCRFILLVACCSGLLRTSFSRKERLKMPSTPNQNPRHLHAWRYQQRRVLPPERPSRESPNTRPSAG